MQQTAEIRYVRNAQYLKGAREHSSTRRTNLDMGNHLTPPNDRWRGHNHFGPYIAFLGPLTHTRDQRYPMMQSCRFCMGCICSDLILSDNKCAQSLKSLQTHLMQEAQDNEIGLHLVIPLSYT